VPLRSVLRTCSSARNSMTRISSERTRTALTTGWMLEADRRRGGPQIFIMQFMGIDDAVARVRRMR